VKRLALVAVAALVLAPEASAKMCVRITTVPARPVVGAPVTIRMTALSIVMANGRARPGDHLIPLAPETEFKVRLISPTATWRHVYVRRRADRPSVLEGRFTFPSAGMWTLSWSAWTNGSNPECAGTKRVHVSVR
jgi:hypothetical protein